MQQTLVNSFHALNVYSLNNSYMSGTVLDTRHIRINKIYIYMVLVN